MRGHRRLLTSHPVTRNNFAALEDEYEDEKTDEVSLSSGKTLVVDQSHVTYFNRAFCVRERKNRMLA